VGVEGGGENFSDGEILKTTTVGSLQYDDYYTILLSRALIQSNIDIQYLILSPIPYPLVESINNLILTNK
jgi:hypothetical protein